MAKVELLYPYAGHERGDIIDVPDDKVGPLRRLHWGREVKEPAPKPKAKPKRRVVEKEPNVDGSIPKETEEGSAD